MQIETMGKQKLGIKWLNKNPNAGSIYCKTARTTNNEFRFSFFSYSFRVVFSFISSVTTINFTIKPLSVIAIEYSLCLHFDRNLLQICWII